MSNSVSTEGNFEKQPTGEEPGQPIVPLWIFKLLNPPMTALLRSPFHKLVSGVLMLITYTGRKTGKSYTHPIGYFQWDTDELLATFSSGWWKNMRDGSPVTLLVKGQRLKAVPTVIREREAVIQTLEEIVRRLGWKTVRLLQVPLPKDREPTPDDLRAIQPGRGFVIFKIVERP